jgi:SAM-dependent methyltransferase
MTDIANTEQYDLWNGENGRRWVADADHRDRMIAEVGDALIAAANLVAGERVLDIGCGCGATSFAAAARVAPGGSVLGVDISATMLDVARARASSAGATDVTFLQADAQTSRFEPGGFDVAVSRFGTMFFADPAAAFANIARALRPGGRLCIATWQSLAANEWLTLPAATLLELGSPPEATGGPGMFAQAEPAVVTSLLSAAGLDDVELTPVSVMLHVGTDAAAAASHLAETGPGRAILETIPAEDRPRAIAAVEALLARRVTADGVRLGGAVWIVTARRFLEQPTSK